VPVSSKNYAEVALNVPLETTFHYRVPELLRDSLEAGMRVRVPFGAREMIGVCVGLSDKPAIAESRMKDVRNVIDDRPIYEERILKLTRWMADYYCCTWAKALDTVLPTAVKSPKAARTVLMVAAAKPPGELLAAAEEAEVRAPRQARALRALAGVVGEISATDLLQQAEVDHAVLKPLTRAGWLTTRKEKLPDSPLLQFEVAPGSAPELDVNQVAVMTRIHSALKADKFHVALLHGVTGSGKTEIYLQALRRVADAGRQGIVLVPEIALTPQTVARFKARFRHVCVIHGDLGEKQRREQWTAIREGRADVVIGARSAIFAPVPKLGLVVVDEEHESSYKAIGTPRYHARDVAVWRARQEQALVILGSATPSLESFHNAQTGRYELLELPQRVEGRPMPPVEILDLGTESAKGKAPLLSRRLKQGIEGSLKKGEQVILFLNRRGFNTYLSCPRCKLVLKCHRCEVSMTYHREHESLHCHYCGYKTPAPNVCPGCHSSEIRRWGAGTERIEEELQRLFGSEPVMRMDQDSMRKAGAYERTLADFRDGKTKILLGTQMLAKGLDFPNVTLVGVINADIILNLPDFRAAERTFQLLAQVAGRAGRGERGGRVIIQTFSPDHPCIRDARTHDYHSFAKRELAARRECNYPPFSRLARLLFEGKDAAAVEARCAEAVEAIRRVMAGPAASSRGKACLAPTPGNVAVVRAQHAAPLHAGHDASPVGQQRVEILGPAPAPIERLKGLWRWHALIKAPDSALLHRALAAVDRRKGTVQLSIDVDPVAMM